MTKWVMENDPDFEEISVEDGGRAAVLTLYGPEAFDAAVEDGEFVRVQSWREDVPGKAGVRADLATYHPLIAALLGRRVRVTIETID